MYYDEDSDKVKSDTADVFQDVNHINFFDLEYPEIPNDDERVDPKLNSNYKSQSASSSSFESCRNYFTADFSVNSRNDADSSDNIFATQDEGVTTLEENIFSEEMDALLRNETWEIVKLPKGRKAIGSKWIFKIKYQSSGEIDRFKARLVAQGFGQNEGIDYEETFSPVIKMVIVRCLLNIVVSNSWPIFQLDVNNAFLYGDLDEVVYMKPPEGYFPSGNKVCRLKKSLYELKLAPRHWSAKLPSTLIENDFIQSKFDYSLYTKSDKGVFLALLVYVDDIIITGNNVFETENFKVFLKSKFMLKALGKLKYFLGIEPINTPLVSKLVISNEAIEKDPVLENISYYQKQTGKLIYLTNTRPDISYVVHCLSQFMHFPLTFHLKTAFKILRYLKGCPGLGIHNAKTLKSKKKKTLTKSLAEAEYIALATVTSEVIWVLKILKDLSIENLLPVSLHCHSNSAIKIAANLVFHERTKHLEIDLYFVREIFLKGVVKTVKVDSTNQIADILTKGLDTVQHKNIVHKLGMIDIYIRKFNLYLVTLILDHLDLVDSVVIELLSR
ncbi:ribonuclease H-like domain-containing protein [Tanacetum coccineum]